MKRRQTDLKTTIMHLLLKKNKIFTAYFQNMLFFYVITDSKVKLLVVDYHSI